MCSPSCSAWALEGLPPRRGADAAAGSVATALSTCIDRAPLAPVIIARRRGVVAGGRRVIGRRRVIGGRRGVVTRLRRIARGRERLDRRGGDGRCPNDGGDTQGTQTEDQPTMAMTEPMGRSLRHRGGNNSQGSQSGDSGN